MENADGVSGKQQDPGSLAIPGHVTEQRIAWLTLLIGFIGAAAVAFGVEGHRTWAAGLAIGTALAWLNFRWLRRGMDGLVRASLAQAGATKPRVPLRTYFLMAFRYGLIGLSVYVIFTYLRVPLVSMLVGLCALGAATLAASLYEIWSSPG
jgi:ATP synthase I chain